ncbi:uncharacterized protein RSE6_09487 [Rhynchosporium secalis]|uniref:Transposase Tc1-like domain-containing protein n=1 Tax=Rhynchosporium secalis TaxID=38038 RepID=A0A1E1MI02_RHYSE|nr:uncharacterized protein RSE6_09487 [Rhynchosporium secalis]
MVQINADSYFLTPLEVHPTSNQSFNASLLCIVASAARGKHRSLLSEVATARLYIIDTFGHLASLGMFSEALTPTSTFLFRTPRRKHRRLPRCILSQLGGERVRRTISEVIIEAPEALNRPKYTKAPELTRDQRRDITLLHSIGWSYSQISSYLPFTPTIRQINYTINTRATPKKKPGRPPILTQAQVEELVEFVCASKQNRRMSYTQLANALEFGVKKDAIRSALLREGFHRRLAMRKPPISETNRKIRLA